MKYLKEAVFSVKWLFIGFVVVLFGYELLNNELLKLVSVAMETRSMTDVNYVIIVCAGTTILETILWRRGLLDKYVYTYLNNLLCDKVLDIDISAFEKFSVGTISTMQSNNLKLANLVKTILNFLTSAATLIVCFIAIARISKIAMIPIVIVGVMFGFVLNTMNTKWAKLDEELQRHVKARNIELSESIYGFNEVRSFVGVREATRESLHGMNGKIMGSMEQRISISQWMTFVVGLASSILTIAGLLYGIKLVEDGILQSGIAVTMILYVWRMTSPFCNVVFGFSDIAEYKAALPLFEEFMNYKNNVLDGSMILDSFEKSISIDNASFFYDKSSTVLHDINFAIKKGEHVGICGESGGGKSTFLKLLLRFYDVTVGAIRIDGINIKDFTLDSLRSKFGIVSQEVHIFEGTIRDNIAYALKPKKVSDEKIIEICKKVKLWDFIEGLAEGLDTNVGANGLKLSGGQKQRISIARVLLANPEIILLDEATSALDNATEKAIKDTLEILKGKTIIAVAHRLTTIKDFDKIFVFGDHTVLASGTHEELLKQCEAYQRIWTE